MAKAKKLTKKEHEAMEATLSLIRNMENTIVEAAVVSSRATSELLNAKEVWEKLSEDLEKKYGSVQIDIKTGTFTDPS